LCKKPSFLSEAHPKVHENFGALVIYQKLVSPDVLYAAIESYASHVILPVLPGTKIVSSL
jgi:hypothetical protein